MTTTSHNATPSNSCFSSVFRRLLCSGGLPTHPSTDTPTTQTTNNNHHHLFKPNSPSSSFKPQSPSPTRTTIKAGVVARLMGLDSFPNPTTSSTRSTRVSLGSIMRSKSSSSVDFLPNFEIVKHRRVRTSVSFREQVHTFLEASHYNHNLGNLGNAKSEMGLAPNQEKFKNSKKGMRVEQEQEQEQEQDKKKKIEVPTFLEASHNLENLGNAKSEVGFAPNQEKFKNFKKGMRGEQEQDKKKKKELKDQGMKVKNKEEVSSSVKLKYRRKRVGFQEEEKGYKLRKRTYNHPLPKMVKHDRRRVLKKQTILKRRESEYSEEYCMKVLVDVFRLTMDEINEGVWMDKKVDNYNLQEVSYEVGQEILQLLVYEMVDELCNS